MVNYECKRCKKVFKQKCHYTRHSNRKFPCEPINRSKCVLCNEEYDGHGNNPYPVTENGRCCVDCNRLKVIPARIHGPCEILKSENEKLNTENKKLKSELSSVKEYIKESNNLIQKYNRLLNT